MQDDYSKMLTERLETMLEAGIQPMQQKNALEVYSRKVAYVATEISEFMRIARNFAKEIGEPSLVPDWIEQQADQWQQFHQKVKTTAATWEGRVQKAFMNKGVSTRRFDGG